MTGLPALLAALRPVGGEWRGHIPPEWMQGRTSYGGLSAALALHVAQASEPDLPPLRSAQVAFVGPLSGEVAIRATRLRRGRNATFVQADVTGAAGLGLRATFVFMQAIASQLAHEAGTAPGLPPPQPGDRTWGGHPDVPFTQRFDHVDAGGDLAPAEWLRWTRVREREGLDPAVELIATADCLPPAAMKLLGERVPLSSVTWLVNLLVPRPATIDGWWLLQARADHARDGSSSQVMRVWDADGRAVAEQMQSVAIFG